MIRILKYIKLDAFLLIWTLEFMNKFLFVKQLNVNLKKKANYKVIM